MIERTQAYKIGTATFGTLEEAQMFALSELLGDGADAAEHIVANREKVIDILTTTATSKPKARKINGGTKKRTSKAPPVVTDQPPMANPHTN